MHLFISFKNQYLKMMWNFSVNRKDNIAPKNKVHFNLICLVVLYEYMFNCRSNQFKYVKIFILDQSYYSNVLHTTKLNLLPEAV